MFFKSSKLSLCYQIENSDCGLCCLQMLMGYHGYHISLNDIRKEHDYGLLGMSIRSLIEVAQHYNFVAEAYRTDLDSLKQLKTPSILHWDFDHFVVLKGVSKRGAVILDPAFGEKLVPWSEVNQRFTGYLLKIKPDEQFQPRNRKHAKFALLKDVYANIKIKKPLAYVLAFSFLFQLIVLAIPFGTKAMVSVAEDDLSIDLLYFLATAFILLHLVGVTYKLLRELTITKLDNICSKALKSLSLTRLLRKSSSEFEKRNISDLQSRLDSLGQFQKIAIQNSSVVILDGLSVALAAMLMLTFNSLLTSIVLVSTSIHFALRAVALRGYSLRYRESKEMEAKEEASILDTLRNVRSVKSYGYEKRRVLDWESKFDGVLSKKVILDRKHAIIDALNQLFSGAELILITLFGALQIIDAQLGFATFVAFLGLRQIYTIGTNKLFEASLKFRDAFVELERAVSVVNLTEKTAEHGDKEVELTGRISLVNVGFKYSGSRTFLFENLSIDICKGDNVAIVGRSGKGKSTLLKVIAGVLQPTQGEVLYDGVNIREISASTRARYLAHIFQGESLFSASIEDNITFFEPKADANLLQSVIELSCLKNTLDSLPLGTATEIGDIGHALSGGQVQRVLLARAMFRLPIVFILDEVTSSLDSETEKNILENLLVGFKSRTKFFVTHSQEVIERCNKVLTV